MESVGSSTHLNLRAKPINDTLTAFMLSAPFMISIGSISLLPWIAKGINSLDVNLYNNPKFSSTSFLTCI